MREHIPDSPNGGSSSFQQIVEAFLAHDGLPFADVLTGERIERAFGRHDALFRQHGVLLHGDRPVGVSEPVAAGWQGGVLSVGRRPNRQSLPPHGHPEPDAPEHGRLLQGPRQVIGNGDARVRPRKWPRSFNNRPTRPGCGRTGTPNLSMVSPSPCRTHPERRRVSPSANAEEGRGPADRPRGGDPFLGNSLRDGCGHRSLQGQGNRRDGVLRSMSSSLHAGDIAVFDRHYCSFMMIALLLLQGTDVCARLHQMRKSDFRRGKRLGKNDHLIIWTKPVCPDWMEQELCAHPRNTRTA